MVNNFTDINNIDNPISPQTTEHKKTTNGYGNPEIMMSTYYRGRIARLIRYLISSEKLLPRKKSQMYNEYLLSL